MAVWRIGGPEKLLELTRSTLPETIWARATTILDDGRIATGTFGSTYALFDPKTSTWDLEGVSAGRAINAVLWLTKYRGSAVSRRSRSFAKPT